MKIVLWTFCNLDVWFVSIQRPFNILQYYMGTQNGVLLINVTSIPRSVTGKFHSVLLLLVTFLVMPLDCI